MVNDGELGVTMALAGLGLVQVFEIAARDHLATGQLESVLDAWQLPLPGFHVYYPARGHMAPKLRVFVGFYKVLPEPA